MNIEIENNQKLDRLLISNPEMTKKVQAIIRKVIKQARAAVQRSAESAITNDPRHASAAVRSAVYKAILGGQVNILNPRRAGAGGSYSKIRTLQPGQRGGNRIPMSERTQRMDSYEGPDRAFILRFINNGTAQRTSRYGNRGAISARRWFGPASTNALENASEQFAQMLDSLIEQETNNG